MEPPKNYEETKIPLNLGDREIFGNQGFRIFKHKSEYRSWAYVCFDKKYHGPPNYVHGGAQAYILDEVMGCTGWMHGFAVVTKKFHVELHRPCPIETKLNLTGEIIGGDSSNLQIRANLFQQEEKVISSSMGEFKILTGELLEQFKTQMKG